MNELEINFSKFNDQPCYSTNRSDSMILDTNESGIKSINSNKKYYDNTVFSDSNLRGFCDL